ncbi:late embryogenesis abundant protein 6-like [Lycium ferocissimum]|uniref:late embryogenesis abundant protein 6-like n=1 Tax=Lycium ferocissimum TaxID=112874 RepID=UPI002815F5E8|nr:late embryogenesis abundant protein 6-like [Lycium ferocissimum]
MHSVKEKVSNAAAAGKEHVDILKAKAEEKAEKAYARTREEKTIAEEVRKAKEAEAKMELHQAKARHAAEKLQSKQAHLGGIVGPHHHGPPVGGQGHHINPVGTTVTTSGTGIVAPTYPPGGYPPFHGHI